MVCKVLPKTFRSIPHRSLSYFLIFVVHLFVLLIFAHTACSDWRFDDRTVTEDFSAEVFSQVSRSSPFDLVVESESLHHLQLQLLLINHIN